MSKYKRRVKVDVIVANDNSDYDVVIDDNVITAHRNYVY